MSACDIMYTNPNQWVRQTSKDVKKPEQNDAVKNAKERLLFCKCTC